MKKIIIFGFYLAVFLTAFCFTPKLLTSASGAGAQKTTISLEPTVAHAYTYGEPSQVTKTLGNKDNSGEWIYKIYNICRGFFNVILLIALILIALSNILHLKIETYGIKKMIMPLLVATVFANIAMPVFVVASRIIDTIQGLHIFRPGGPTLDYVLQGASLGQKGGIFAVFAAVGLILVGSVSGIGCCVGILIFLATIVVSLILYLIISLRPYVVYLAAAVSPLAVACSIIPATQQYFKKWLNIAVVWMIMPLAVYGLINLGYLIPTNTGGGGNWIANLVGFFLPALVRLGLLVLAVRFPFAIEKDISGALGSAGKWLGGRAYVGSGHIGDKAYVRNKQREMDERARLSSEADKLGLRGQAKTDHIEGITGRDENGDPIYNENAGMRKLNNSWKTKAINISGAIGSMPAGVVEGIRAGREIKARERVKSPQKMLFKGISQWGVGPDSPYNPLKPFNVDAVRSKLGNMKYFEAIIESDLRKNLNVDQILDYIGRDKFRKITNNARTKYGFATDEEAQRFALDQMTNLHIFDESVGTWQNQQIMAGLRGDEVASLKVGFSRMWEQAVRHSQYGGNIEMKKLVGDATMGKKLFGLPVAPEVQEYMDRRDNRGRAPDMGAGAGGISEIPEEEEEVGPPSVHGYSSAAEAIAAGKQAEESAGIGDESGETEALLGELITITKRQPGELRGAFSSAFQRASDTGVSATQALHFDDKSDLALKRLEVRLDNPTIQKLRAIDMLTMKQQMGELRSKFEGNAEIIEALDEFQTAEVGRMGAYANSPQASSVQRVLKTLVPNLQSNPADVPALSKACETVLSSHAETSNLSPEVISVAVDKVKQYFPSALVSQIPQGDGRSTPSIDDNIINQIKLGIEAATVSSPSGQIQVITDPTVIQAKTALQVKRDIEQTDIQILESEPQSAQTQQQLNNKRQALTQTEAALKQNTDF